MDYIAPQMAALQDKTQDLEIDGILNLSGVNLELLEK